MDILKEVPRWGQVKLLRLARPGARVKNVFSNAEGTVLAVWLRTGNAYIDMDSGGVAHVPLPFLENDWFPVS